MQKIKLLFIAMLLPAMVYAQDVTGEERAVQQSIEKMFTAFLMNCKKNYINNLQ